MWRYFMQSTENNSEINSVCQKIFTLGLHSFQFLCQATIQRSSLPTGLHAVYLQTLVLPRNDRFQVRVIVLHYNSQQSNENLSPISFNAFEPFTHFSTAFMSAFARHVCLEYQYFYFLPYTFYHIPLWRRLYVYLFVCTLCNYYLTQPLFY